MVSMLRCTAPDPLAVKCMITDNTKATHIAAHEKGCWSGCRIRVLQNCLVTVPVKIESYCPGLSCHRPFMISTAQTLLPVWEMEAPVRLKIRHFFHTRFAAP